jgi:hypothetical protein
MHQRRVNYGGNVNPLHAGAYQVVHVRPAWLVDGVGFAWLKLKMAIEG